MPDIPSDSNDSFIPQSSTSSTSTTKSPPRSEANGEVHLLSRSLIALTSVQASSHPNGNGVNKRKKKKRKNSEYTDSDREFEFYMAQANAPSPPATTTTTTTSTSTTTTTTTTTTSTTTNVNTAEDLHIVPRTRRKKIISEPLPKKKLMMYDTSLLRIPKGFSELALGDKNKVISYKGSELYLFIAGTRGN